MNDETHNPLDLNNLPDDFSVRDNGKQTQFEAASSSSSGVPNHIGKVSRKKKKDNEDGKMYECRFCSLKFCKSQALGGHMNRHRQERETESLNKARMLVFSNENNLPAIHGLPAHHLRPLGPNEGFNQQAIDGTVNFRQAYPMQSMSLPSNTQSVSTILQHQHNSAQSYLYPSTPQPQFVPSYHSPYICPLNESCVGHCLGTTSPEITNYTCIGTPVGSTSFGSCSINGVRENKASSEHTSVTDAHHNNGKLDDGLNWGRRWFGGTPHQQLQAAATLDLSASLTRFQNEI